MFCGKNCNLDKYGFSGEPLNCFKINLRSFGSGCKINTVIKTFLKTVAIVGIDSYNLMNINTQLIEEIKMLLMLTFMSKFHCLLITLKYSFPCR